MPPIIVNGIRQHRSLVLVAERLIVRVFAEVFGYYYFVMKIRSSCQRGCIVKGSLRCPRSISVRIIVHKTQMLALVVPLHDRNMNCFVYLCFGTEKIMCGAQNFADLGLRLGYRKKYLSGICGGLADFLALVMETTRFKRNYGTNETQQPQQAIPLMYELRN